MSELSNVAIPICITIILAFGLWALYLAHLQKNVSKNEIAFFLTARNTQTSSMIAWSFFSASVGAWVLFVPSSFCVDPEFGAGYVGLISYSIFSGIPILIIAWTGGIIRKRYPNVLSIGDFVNARYGQSVEIYVSILVLINTSIALAAEYTAIGDLFENVLGSSRITPILFVGAVTATYTAVGGLFVSIVTDKYQSIFSTILFFITISYVAATFRPVNLPALPPYLDANYEGFSSIATLAIALPASSFFTDSMWQRVWSSDSERSLKIGAVFGALLTVLFIFTMGLMGFLASWSGYVTNPSTSFFDILKVGNEAAPIWIIVVVCVIAVTLNESAVDSFQNALTSTIMTLAISFGLKATINHARIVSILVNIPVMIAGLYGFKITSLYLIMNILTTTAMPPLILGLFQSLEPYIGGSAVLFGFSFSLAAVIVYGYIATGDIATGIYKYFYQVYAWEPFVIALVSSIIGVGIWVFCESMVFKVLGLPRISHFHTEIPELPEQKEDFSKEEDIRNSESDFERLINQKKPKEPTKALVI